MADNILDFFHTDPFGVISLTDALNNIKFVPGRIAQMGIFSASGIPTTTVAIETRSNILILVPPSPRGGVGTTRDKAKRNVLNLTVPHFELMDSIMAEEVQGVRSFGTPNQLQVLMDRVAERGSEASQSMAATSEYSQLGAIIGVVTYADGTTLDLFATFGVTQITEVGFDLLNASPASGVLRKTCSAQVRAIANELGGIPWDGKLYAFCGDNFFDALLAHPEVRETFKNWTDAQILREGYIDPSGKSFGAFEFGGIVFENYRGAVGGTTFVDTDHCYIFPMGVPSLFRTYWAPADYIETVNTMGQRLYAKQYDMPNGKGIYFDVQMNELNICTRPRCLIKGRKGA